MPVNFLEEADRERLNHFPPEILPDDVLTYFGLTELDLTKVREHRGDENKLGWALQLGALRYMGFFPTDFSHTPPNVVAYLATQLGVETSVLTKYATRGQTRSDHTKEICQYLGYRDATKTDLKELEDWLLHRALEHDKPLLLLGLAAEKLKKAKIVRPGVTILARLVASVRDKAQAETYRLLADLFTPERTAFLDSLLKHEEELRGCRLEWLRQEATTNSTKAILANLKKLDYLRQNQIDKLKLVNLNPNRRKHLARVAAKSTPYLLNRMSAERRWPLLLNFVVQAYEDIIDETLDLFIANIGEANSRAGNDLEEFRLNKARTTDDKVRHFQAIGSIILSEEIADSQLRQTIFQYLPKEQLAAQVEECNFLVRPTDNTYYDFLLASFKTIRTYSPKFLEAFTFHANPATQPLLDAIDTMKAFNQSNKRQLSNHSTLAFVPGKWQNYVLETNGSINRYYYELAILWELRTALRAGNIWVEGSRRYATVESYLIPSELWPQLRDEVCAEIDAPVDGAVRLNELAADLEKALTKLETMLNNVPQNQAKIRIEENKFILTPLEASDLPKSVLDLRAKIEKRLPLVELVSLLIEVDRWTTFTDNLEHAGEYQPESVINKKGHLYAAILAQACNFSLKRLERASNFQADRLAYYTNWYLREETLRPAITRLVNFHYHQPLARHWGNGTLSSSDGQRFPVAVKNRKSRSLPRYFGYGKGLTFYTWTSDQNSQFGSKPIISTDRDALYVLDEFQNNETELPLLEHTTDTAGFTDLVFGLFSLLGLQFSPRIRDIGAQHLYRLERLDGHPLLKPMLQGYIDQKLIVAHWDELLRVAGSIKLGYVTASLLIGKLQSFPQQNSLTKALKEYGKLVKTIFILRYYESEEYRHRIEAQLNKGEGLHSLREFIFFANWGLLRKSKMEDQINQANCFTLVTNAVIVWNTVYMSAVLESLQKEGQAIAEADLVHLSPTRFEHINIYGRYHFNVEEEMKRVGLRELRPG